MTDPRVLVRIATVLVVTVATTPTRTRAVQNPSREVIHLVFDLASF
jgi:hypothetical protein